MSDNQSGGWGFLDKALGNIERVGNVWAQQELAKKGVNMKAPSVVQTTGANDPGIATGQPANVQAVNPLVDAVNNFTNKTAMVAGANEFRKSLPYLVGGMAMAITIYLLTKKG